MKKNDIITVEVETLASEGQGVGRIDGMAIFVPFALPGETVQVQIIKMQKRYAVGKLLEVLQPSEDRQEAKCEYFGKCGGCQWQNLSYPAQLAAKRQVAVDAFTRICGWKEADEMFPPTIGMKTPWNYRNKVSLPCRSDASGQLHIGFFAARSHRLVPVQDCPLQEQSITPLIRAVKEWAQKHALTAYNEETGKGLIRHLFLRNNSHGQSMVVVSTTGKLPQQEDLIATLREQIPGLVSIVHNINKKPGNRTLGSEFHAVWGSKNIAANICGLTFFVSAASFMQVNTMQCEALYHTALGFVDWMQIKTVVDAYCGMGTLALLTAQHCEKVLGIETVAEAVEDAKRNAIENQIDNAQFVCAKVEEEWPKLAESGELPDLLILDPPRKGCEASLIETIASKPPRYLLYISCNPATQARDCKELLAAGYQIVKAQQVDMFPQTVHVESVVLMERTGG